MKAKLLILLFTLSLYTCLGQDVELFGFEYAAYPNASITENDSVEVSFREYEISGVFPVVRKEKFNLLTGGSYRLVIPENNERRLENNCAEVKVYWVLSSLIKLQMANLGQRWMRFVIFYLWSSNRCIFAYFYKAMNIPGLLVEYIISGLILLLSLSLFMSEDPATVDVFKGLLAIPVAYILGMLVDLLAYVLIRRPKRFIRKRAVDTLDKTFRRDELKAVKSSITTQLGKRGYTDYITTKLYSVGLGELVKEVNWRSSRDRIARGMIVNAPVLVLAIVSSHYPSAKLIYLILAALSLTILFSIIWWYSELMSIRFQMRVHAQIILKDG